MKKKISIALYEKDLFWPTPSFLVLHIIFVSIIENIWYHWTIDSQLLVSTFTPDQAYPLEAKFFSVWSTESRFFTARFFQGRYIHSQSQPLTSYPLQPGFCLYHPIETASIEITIGFLTADCFRAHSPKLSTTLPVFCKTVSSPFPKLPSLLYLLCERVAFLPWFSLLFVIPLASLSALMISSFTSPFPDSTSYSVLLSLFPTCPMSFSKKLFYEQLKLNIFN